MLKEKKLNLNFITRDEDLFCWNFSNKGYFNFKSNIPKILSNVDLIIDPEHFLEQYFTLSQLSFHFFRQTKGLLQIGQIFVGRSNFFITYF